MSPKFVLTYLGDVWTIKMVCFGDQDCNFLVWIRPFFQMWLLLIYLLKCFKLQRDCKNRFMDLSIMLGLCLFHRCLRHLCSALKTIKCHSLTHSLSDKVTYWAVLEIYWLLDVIVCSYDCVDAYVRIMSGRCFSLFCVCMQNGITPFSFSSVGKRQTESSN